MFEKKQENLMEKKENLFVKTGIEVSNECLSGNGALKYKTSGNEFVDNFALLGNFKSPRTYNEVAKDMEILWSINPQMCLKLAVYCRLITRKSKIVEDNKSETLDTQRGQGLKNEGIMRLMWIALNHSNTFKINIPYFIAAGSWKDIIQMLSLDLQYNGWNNRKLDWNFFYNVLSAGLMNPETTHLVRKYLPTIRTNKKCKTIESQADTLIGRWFANKMFRNEKASAYKKYRLMKTEGKAHEWQQLISKELYNKINFDTIAGRALMLLVGSKFLENNNLESKYEEWISNKPIAKFTGYVFELFKDLNPYTKKYRKDTINAQFAQLIEEGKGNKEFNSNFLVVRDVSGSMESCAKGTNVTSFDIAKAMALYFSYFLNGYFKDTYASFEGKCELYKWIGTTPCDNWINDHSGWYGSTNFQSVIDLFICIKDKGISESEFPKGILCISDGEFNGYKTNTSTNFRTALRRLREAGFSKEFVDNFKIILWDIPNDFYSKDIRPKFESSAEDPNFFYLSGYDPSIISFLLGVKGQTTTPKTAKELFEAAMNQELLNNLKVNNF